MRLDRYLHLSGLGSRKEVKSFIKQKRIMVNDQLVLSSKLHINEQDTIKFNGKTVRYQPFVYYMLNKPTGCLSASRDPFELTVIDLIDDYHDDLFPVGRLDKDTTGLILISNNGKLAHALLSPRHHVKKIYEAYISGRITHEDIKAFREGIKLKDFKTLPGDIEVLEEFEDQSYVRITIMEGKYHQIKRMISSRGKQVLQLKRISMGPLILDDALKEGDYRSLSQEEIDSLLSEFMIYL